MAVARALIFCRECQFLGQAGGTHQRGAVQHCHEAVAASAGAEVLEAACACHPCGSPCPLALPPHTNMSCLLLPCILQAHLVPSHDGSKSLNCQPGLKMPRRLQRQFPSHQPISQRQVSAGQPARRVPVCSRLACVLALAAGLCLVPATGIPRPQLLVLLSQMCACDGQTDPHSRKRG